MLPAFTASQKKLEQAPEQSIVDFNPRKRNTATLSLYTRKKVRMFEPVFLETVDEFVDVTAFAVLHHDVEDGGGAVDDAVVVSNDVLVT